MCSLHPLLIFLLTHYYITLQPLPLWFSELEESALTWAWLSKTFISLYLILGVIDLTYFPLSPPHPVYNRGVSAPFISFNPNLLFNSPNSAYIYILKCRSLPLCGRDTALFGIVISCTVLVYISEITRHVKEKLWFEMLLAAYRGYKWLSESVMCNRQHTQNIAVDLFLLDNNSSSVCFHNLFLTPPLQTPCPQQGKTNV